MISKILVKLLALLIFALNGLSANAQSSLIQKTIDNLESYKSLSYKYVYKQKEVFNDTLILHEKVTLLKVPEDKQIGYYFRKEMTSADMHPSVEFYNGESLFSLTPGGSTYNTSNTQKTSFGRLLPGQLNWIKNFLKKDTSKLVKAADTVVNSINSYHLILTTRDTVINKEHLYTRKHLFIAKATGLPVAILTRARTADFGIAAADYYVQESYDNFVIGQESINATYFSIPKGFKLYKQPEKISLLVPGTAAPDWTLYNTEGKKTSLSSLKGKVVLLDFFFIGCTGCMQTLAPLDKLYEKFKTKNLVLLSISVRDNNQSIKAFKKNQRIKNPMFANGGNVAKLYNAAVFPTFYLIDTKGRITDVVNEYTDGLERKITTLIDNSAKQHKPVILAND